MMPDQTMSVVSFEQSANVLCAFTHEANAAAPTVDLFATSGLTCRAWDATLGTFEIIVPVELLKIAEFKLDHGLIASPRSYRIVDDSPARIVAPLVIQNVQLTTTRLTITLSDSVLEQSTVYALVAAEGEPLRRMTRLVRPTDPVAVELNDVFTSGTEHRILVLVDGLLPKLVKITP